jgi:predicted Zn-dependent protease
MRRLPLLALLGFLTACSTNAATGQQQFTGFLPESQEAEIGAEADHDIIAEFGYYKDDRLQAYVGRVGAGVAATTERQDIPYRFTLLDSNVVNAMALPGGYIYVTRGLLALLNTEGELAAVLGHELGHVNARHTAERYSQSILVGIGAAVLSQAVGSQEAGQIAQIGSALYLSSYSRNQESQADGLGIRYSSRAGFDPRSMGWALGDLDRERRLNQILGGETPTEEQMNFFATHPQTAERVGAALAQAEAYPRSGIDQGRNALLDALDGMIWGDGPEQGYVRGRDFIHTELGFRFTVPAGFAITNTPQQVMAENGQGATVLFDIADIERDVAPANYLAAAVGDQIALTDIEKIRVDGRDAVTGSARITTQSQGEMDLRIVAVHWAPKTYYRLFFLSPPRQSAALRQGFLDTTYSLRGLRSGEAAQYKPYRIRIHQVRAGETVSSIARSMAVGEHAEEIFRTLNAIDAPLEVEPGMRVKVIGW